MKKKKKKNIYSVLKLALKNASFITNILTQKKKKRKPVYIPFFIKKSKRVSIAMKNIIQASRSSSYKNNFVSEILNISSNKGSLRKVIKNTHLKSFINKNFAHYRWF
jgi:ribosomal protein S7